MGVPPNFGQLAQERYSSLSQQYYQGATPSYLQTSYPNPAYIGGGVYSVTAGGSSSQQHRLPVVNSGRAGAFEVKTSSAENVGEQQNGEQPVWTQIAGPSTFGEQQTGGSLQWTRGENRRGTGELGSGSGSEGIGTGRFSGETFRSRIRSPEQYTGTAASRGSSGSSSRVGAEVSAYTRVSEGRPSGTSNYPGGSGPPTGEPRSSDIKSDGSSYVSEGFDTSSSDDFLLTRPVGADPSSEHNYRQGPFGDNLREDPRYAKLIRRGEDEGHSSSSHSSSRLRNANNRSSDRPPDRKDPASSGTFSETREARRSAKRQEAAEKQWSQRLLLRKEQAASPPLRHRPFPTAITGAPAPQNFSSEHTSGGVGCQDPWDPQGQVPEFYEQHLEPFGGRSESKTSQYSIDVESDYDPSAYFTDENVCVNAAEQVSPNKNVEGEDSRYAEARNSENDYDMGCCASIQKKGKGQYAPGTGPSDFDDVDGTKQSGGTPYFVSNKIEDVFCSMYIFMCLREMWVFV